MGGPPSRCQFDIDASGVELTGSGRPTGAAACGNRGFTSRDDELALLVGLLG